MHYINGLHRITGLTRCADFAKTNCAALGGCDESCRQEYGYPVGCRDVKNDDAAEIEIFCMDNSIYVLLYALIQSPYGNEKNHSPLRRLDRLHCDTVRRVGTVDFPRDVCRAGDYLD